MRVVSLEPVTSMPTGDSQKEPANTNQESAQIIQLVPNKRIARNVPAKSVYKQIETMLVANGICFTCEQNSSDFQIISFMIQAMFDRLDGNTSSNRSMLGETLRLVFAGDSASHDDTNELFGDLLGKL